MLYFDSPGLLTGCAGERFTHHDTNMACVLVDIQFIPHNIVDQIPSLPQIVVSKHV
jgi:hypothetical protein